MDFSTALLNFVNVTQLETQTLPTQADIAARFPESADVSWWLNHLVGQGLLISHMLTYAITDKGLTQLERLTGVSVLVSSTMIISIDPADDPAAFNEFKEIVLNHRNSPDDFNAQFMNNHPKLMYGNSKKLFAVYFSDFFPAETAANFRK